MHRLIASAPRLRQDRRRPGLSGVLDLGGGTSGRKGIYHWGGSDSVPLSCLWRGEKGMNMVLDRKPG